MPNNIFFLILSENMGWYIISLLLSAIPMYCIAKNYSHSWLDPLRISLVFVALANAVLLFLFFIDEINSYLFYYSVIAISLFWIGFLIPAKRNIKFSKIYFHNDELIIKLLFFEILVLYISGTLFSYIAFGLPIFSESRIGTYIGSGGFGAIARINPFFEVFILMFCYKQLDGKCSLAFKSICYGSIVLIAVVGIISGSRGGLLIFFTCYFGYSFFYLGVKSNDKKMLKYFPVAFFGAILVLLVTNDWHIFDAILALLVRIVATGDAYYMGLPNETINLVQVDNSAMFLLSNLLAPIGLIDISKIEPPVGVQLANILYPQLDGLFVGPNSGPAILGYVLFGYFGIFFTFIVGLVSSILIFRLPSIFPRGFVPSVVLFFIYISSVRFMIDTTYGLASLFDVALNLVVLLILLAINYSIKFSLIKLPLPSVLSVRRKKV